MCGIVGIISDYPVDGNLIMKKLALLQHRGQESYGSGEIAPRAIGSGDRDIGSRGDMDRIATRHYTGHVNPGPNSTCVAAVAHTRYSTSGKDNASVRPQPYVSASSPAIAIVHNGNVPDAEILAKSLGLTAAMTCDSELFINYLTSHTHTYTVEKALIQLLHKVPGAYSLIVLTFDPEGKPVMYAVRDRYGIRPLCVGRRALVGVQATEFSYCYASESVALENYLLLGDIQPGSIVKCDGHGQEVVYQMKPLQSGSRPCSFETIYFKSHRSLNIYNQRYALGYELGLAEDMPAQSAHTSKPIVVCMPNTAISYAEGFAQATGLQFHKTWVQKVNPDRTFILPTQALRIEACSKVYSVNKEIAGRVIYLVDDSIVRGNTMKAIIKQLRLIGVLEIHVRVGSPPVINPCVYGIDIPSSTELIAHGRTISDVSTIIGSDTLKYLPVEQLCQSSTACTRCFGGDMLW